MKRTMCVWLPNWPVQRVRVETGENRPLILYAKATRGVAVTACSHSAAQGGVRPGMPRGEAEALWAGRAAAFVKHDAAAGRAGLRKRAVDCYRYTPVVAVEEADAPECLLLDITGSSHLFGGESKLAEKTVEDFRGLGYAVRIGIADGVGAAWAVAHSLDLGHGSRQRGPSLPFAIVAAGKNRDTVPELSVDVLRLTPDVVQLLRQFDLRRIRQLMDLPRGQVVARFGQETILRLDQALGDIPEIVVPERHVEPVRAVWTFEEPVSHPHVIENVLERLIHDVVGTLVPRHVGVRRLLCSLTTVDKNRTDFAVGLLHPSVSAGQLVGLVRLRLERTTLPAAVATIKVRALVAPLDIRQGHWFESEDNAQRHAAFRDFVERVSSRLGDEAVLQPRLCAEEQPELSWEYVPWLRRRHQSATHLAAIGSAALAYPIDLFAGPQAVHVETGPPDQRPRQFAWRQRLYDIARAWGPQRIETGWWRGHDIRRDYYRVEAAGGERFWLFRDCGREAWFLHGVFA